MKTKLQFQKIYACIFPQTHRAPQQLFDLNCGKIYVSCTHNFQFFCIFIVRKINILCMSENWDRQLFIISSIQKIM